MMNLIIQLVRTALCGRQEKSCVTGRLLSERLRRFGVVFLLAISVTGGFFTTPGQVRAAQGYYISSFLYLWGEDLTEQTKIPVTVADGLQTLGTGVDTLADVLKNGQLTGGPSVFKVVIAKANISGYPLLAGLSGTPSADGVFTIGDGSTNTPVSIKYTHFQNDGIVNITDASRLYDDSTGTFTNNGTINVSAWGYFVQTTSNNQLIGGVVNLSGYWDLGATKILMLPNYSSFSVQGGHFKNVVDINQ
ncbi:MAG: hypothetical protein J0665_02240, partial [Deltaproteobacteria bacterium]|nr:hypothetical protein [Deltaproteobacteria bacterium]